MAIQLNFFDFVFILLSLINLAMGIFSMKREDFHRKPLRDYRPSVTVIARTWDDGHIVERFIKNVLNQDYKGKVQLIIADDASTDGTTEVCRKYGRKIAYVGAKRHHEKKAEFLNKVIKKHASGEILVNTDIDAVMPKDWLRNLVEHFSDKEVQAVCGPAYSGNHDTNWLTKMRTVEDFWLFSSGTWGRYNMLGTATTYGSNHAVRMKTLKKVGYYGTKTLTEDAELTTALWEKGCKVAMCRKAYVLVESVDDLGSFIRERKRWVSGTLETGLMYGSRRGVLSSTLFAISALAGFISIIAFLMSNYPWPIFIINAAAVMLSMLSFRSKPYLLLWVPVFLIVGTLLNILVILYISKDYLLGEKVKWVKVEGERYHKGVGLKNPFTGR
jgi:cellulose synthase/poly-beta-1,6-N-acetylglucosamine synthase-like glycosyltransferase